MATPYTHITKVGRHGSGISDYLLIAPVSAFAVNGIKCPNPLAVAPADVEVVGDHVFGTAGPVGFVKIKMSHGSGELMGNIAGTTGSLKIAQEVKGFIAGSDNKLHSFIKNALNDEFIILVKDSSCTEEMYYQLGCDCNFAVIKGEGGFKSGKLKDGQKGYEVTFEYYSDAVQIYTGVVTIAP